MTRAKQQICIIGGGMAFASDADFRAWLSAVEIDYSRLFYGTDWKPWLAGQLPDCDVLQPAMPNKQNARYTDWVTYFGKIVPFLEPSAVLIGHSLGGIFLAKYFSEHLPRQPFAKIILIAAPYDDETSESLGDFKLTSASKLADAARAIDLIYSVDDPVVPYTELAKYQSDLPAATTYPMEGKQHFSMPEFPELLTLLQ